MLNNKNLMLVSMIILMLLTSSVMAVDVNSNEEINRVAIRGYDKVDHDFTLDIAYNYQRPYKVFYFWDHEGDWVEWKIEIPETQEYALIFMYASALEAPQRQLEIEGEVIFEEIVFPGTGGWGDTEEEWAHIVLNPKEGILLEAGTKTFKMTSLIDGGLNIGWIGLIPPENLEFEENVDVEDPPLINSLTDNYIDDLVAEFELRNPE